MMILLLGPISIGGAFILNNLGINVALIAMYATLVGFIFGVLVR